MANALSQVNRRRFVAFIIDYLPFLGLSLLIAYVKFDFASVIERSRIDSETYYTYLRYIQIGAMVPWIVYGTIIESSNWGTTVGKMIMGLQVVDEDGDQLSAARAGLRNMIKLVLAFFMFIGFVWCIFDPNKKGVQDYFSGSRVIHS